MSQGLPLLPEREFYTMGEACRISQVPPHTLRYWESRFGSLKPARRSGGHRRYTRGDLEMIFSIKGLLEGKKMTIAGARKALLQQRKGASAPVNGEAPLSGDALRILREVRKEIQSLVEELSS